VRRYATTPRPGWEQTIESQGLVYWKTELPSGDVISYWDESHYYQLSYDEVTRMEGTVRALMDLLVAAGDHIIEHDLFERLGIPASAVPRIRETWEREPPMVYGRFDFAYTGRDLKLLEYNADTPTCLVETAVQWAWMRDQFGDGGDQWNRVHEALVERWEELRVAHRIPEATVHFLHSETEQSGEDFITTSYLLETARQAGYRTVLMPIEHLGFDDRAGFVDPQGEQVQTAFKLYPWEWMLAEPFAEHALGRMGFGAGRTQWIEPIWKLLWCSKGILPVLWKLAPGHPNLVPAWFADEVPPHVTSYVRKPLFGREGANTQVVIDGVTVEDGPDSGYGDEGFVVQEYVDLGNYDGARPVLGIWTVDMEPQGLVIRESSGYVTNNQSRFVPHVVGGARRRDV
jgi:glutathionylspermidine synthase